MSESAERVEIAFGETVYDKAGIEALSAEYVTAGSPGEAELMWRCWSCGAMGEIEDIPQECPDCGAPKEDIDYWTED